MDSPPDLSPNEDPALSDLRASFTQQPNRPVEQEKHPGPETVSSSNDSVDSSGFEKVEANSDLLAEYSANFANQMAQAKYAQLPDDPTARRPSNYDSGDEGEEMSSGGHDDVLEKTYGDISDKVADLIGGFAEEDAATALKKAVEEAPKRVDEYLHRTGKDWEPNANAQASDDVNDLLGGPLPTEEAEKKPLVEDEFNDEESHPEEPKFEVHEFGSLSAPLPVHEESLHKQSEHEPEPLLAKPTDLYGDSSDQEKPSEDAPKEDKEDLFISGDLSEQVKDEVSSPGGDSGRDTVGKLLGEASDDDEPFFGGRTPEETTYDRQGPLTIPSDIIEGDAEDSIPPPPTYHTAAHHHGFETEPRPPTPPKDISDEDVKPSSVRVGAGHEVQHHDPHRSILKHSSSTPTHRSSAKENCCPFYSLRNLDPQVLDLIYWRDPKKSGIALGSTLLVLFIFARYPLLSVLSYLGLTALVGTVGFRVLKAAEAQLKKTEGGNPFQPYLEKDISIPADKVREQVDVIIEHGDCLVKQLRRLFLVEDVLDSLKFGVLLWTMTHVAAWFSGCTLIFLAVLAVFTVPKLYETYQEPIDAHLGAFWEKVDYLSAAFDERFPSLRKKSPVVEEKKEQ